MAPSTWLSTGKAETAPKPQVIWLNDHVGAAIHISDFNTGVNHREDIWVRSDQKQELQYGLRGFEKVHVAELESSFHQNSEHSGGPISVTTVQDIVYPFDPFHIFNYQGGRRQMLQKGLLE